jgi:hypothetical protein
MKFFDSRTLRKKENSENAYEDWEKDITQEMYEQVKVNEIHGHPDNPHPRMY